MLEFEEDDPDSGTKKYRDIYYATKNREGGGGHCRWRKKKIKNEGSAEVKKIWGRDKGENPIIHGRRCEN